MYGTRAREPRLPINIIANRRKCRWRETGEREQAVLSGWVGGNDFFLIKYRALLGSAGFRDRKRQYNKPHVRGVYIHIYRGGK